MSVKKTIRDIEEELPTITEYIQCMTRNEQLLYLIPYYQIERHKKFCNSKHLRLLDVGYGDELFPRIFQKSCQNSKNSFLYVGIDMSRKKLIYAKKFFKDNHLDTNLILADANNLPVKNSLFDISLCIEVLEHFPDPFSAVCELRNALNSQGKLLVTTPTAYGTKGNFLNIIKRFILLQKAVGDREHHINLHGKSFLIEILLCLNYSKFSFRVLTQLKFTVLIFYFFIFFLINLLQKKFLNILLQVSKNMLQNFLMFGEIIGYFSEKRERFNR